MIGFDKGRRRAAARALLPMLAVASIAVAAAGCGSSGEATTGSPAKPPSAGVEGGGGVASSGSDKGGSAAHGGERSAPIQAGSRRSEAPGEPSPGAGTRGAAPMGGSAARQAARQCPATLTRAQCVAHVKAMAEKTASYRVSKPSDCLKAMSRDECKGKAVAQQAGEEDSPASVGPEDCLQVYSREQCEALYGERARAQSAVQEAGE